MGVSHVEGYKSRKSEVIMELAKKWRIPPKDKKRMQDFRDRNVPSYKLARGT